MFLKEKFKSYLAAIVLSTASAAAIASPVGYALTSDQKLYKFYSDGGVMIETLRGTLSGFANDDSAIVGIDYRVQDGSLYGIGNGNGVYRINPQTGNLVYVHDLGIALSGTKFGVDFNPAANRLRIVSDTGQSLRHDVATGITLSDGTLNYALATGAAGMTSTNVHSAGYTNNDLNSDSGTALFVLDAVLDQVALVSPPNAGLMVPTGKFGLDATEVNGFDIRTRPEGFGTRQMAYAAMTVGGVMSLYAIDLLDGSILGVGDFTIDVMDISFPTKQ